MQNYVQEYDHSRELAANDAIINLLEQEIRRIVLTGRAAQSSSGSAASNRNIVDESTITRLLHVLFNALAAHKVTLDSALRQALIVTLQQYEGSDLERAQKSLSMDVYDILHDEMIFVSVLKQVDRSYREEMEALQRSVQPQSSSVLVKELRTVERLYISSEMLGPKHPLQTPTRGAEAAVGAAVEKIIIEYGLCLMILRL